VESHNVKLRSNSVFDLAYRYYLAKNFLHRLKLLQNVCTKLFDSDFAYFWRFIAPPLVAVVYWWFLGLKGFNPTDDGFILSQSWRILHGEIPHRDFTSPRPVGSALLHLPVVTAQSYMLAISRLIVAFQMLWISVALIEIMNSKKRVGGPFLTFTFVCASFILNLNSWPLMAWHTIDGLFVSVTAFWLMICKDQVFQSRLLLWVVIWLLAGFSTLIKQGFLITPLFILIVLLFKKRWKCLMTAPVAFIPPFLYLNWVGGLNEGLYIQIYKGNSGEIIRRLLNFYEYLSSPKGFTFSMIALALTLLTRMNFNSIFRNSSHFLLCIYWASFFSIENPRMGGSWTYAAPLSIVFFGTLLLFYRKHEYVLPTLTFLVLAFGTSISWGVPYPSLMSGSLLVLSIALYLSCVCKGAISRKKPLASENQLYVISRSAQFSMVILLTFVSIVCIQTRKDNVYFETKYSSLNYKVNDRQFTLVTMSKQSATYIESVIDCTSRFPAARVAVLPDNPGLYPLLGLRNPFDRDWFLVEETTLDTQSRIKKDIFELNQSTDWLVLIQSYSAADIKTLSPTEVNVNGLPFYYQESDRKLINELQGSDVLCESFSGRYKGQ
jgi:hypothetical protein